MVNSPVPAKARRSARSTLNSCSSAGKIRSSGGKVFFQAAGSALCERAAAAERFHLIDQLVDQHAIAICGVAQAERSIGRDQKPGWGVIYTAGCLNPLVREGSGAGHGIDVETDAMKRALMTFGNPFGLALDDKAQR